MIERYTREEMRRVWSEENRFKKWLQVELAVCRAWAEVGRIPKEAVERIERKVRIDGETVRRIKEYEKVYKHEVLAFVSAISEQVGEDGRYIHLGITSSDVIDTALALQMIEAVDIILGDVDLLLEELRRLAHRYKDTLMIGRTHGVHAEPITLGLKFAVWFDEMRRNKERLLRAKEAISFGKIAGAVGTFSNVPPEVERIALESLGLKPEPAPTQIVHRDRHAELLFAIAVTASSLEKFATEIRHLQRTEVLEVLEPFTEGQRGSSAMPHKKNPIHSERICGLARIVRSSVLPALENVVLWHERDISHSSAERIILPDATTALDYMLNLFLEILKGLEVNEEKMKKNMELSNRLYFSSKVLVALTEKGLSREEAYDLVQRCAMKSWEEGRDFMEVLMEEPEVTKLLSEEELRSLFDPWDFVKHRDYIFRRVFG